MTIVKKLLTQIMILVMITTILLCSSSYNISAISSISTGKIVKVGVVHNDSAFSSLIIKNLEDIQKENKDKVKFIFFNGKGNPAIESEILSKLILGNYDLIIANIADTQAQELINDSIDKAKQRNIPLIFVNVTPTPSQIDKIKRYSKALVVDIDNEEAGIQQGKMIAEFWNANKDTIDKNNDNIMQYIMIKGRLDRFATDARTKYSISTINSAGIKTQELATVSSNWDEELAKSAIESLFLKYAGNLEVIIANNDAMAIGAVKALQKYGYNIGDTKKNIPVFGINKTSEAKELISKGFLAGSVPENPRGIAEVLYTVGMNLVSGRDPIKDTNYKVDKSGVIILIQPQEDISENGNQ